MSGGISQSEGSSLAFDLGSSDDLTRKNHGGRYGSIIFVAVITVNRTVPRPRFIMEHLWSTIQGQECARSSAESEPSEESCHTPPAAEIPSVHKEEKYIVLVSSLLNLISMCCYVVCGSTALQTRHKEVWQNRTTVN